MILTPNLPRRYVPHRPTVKQSVFLYSRVLEALYGGEAGGGKSDALLMGGLEYVERPEYKAILFRRTYKDLALPEALMDRSHDWLEDTPARWRDVNKTWYFPSGATLTFGYLQNERQKYRYQSAAFHFIGFDELTQFPLSQYTYLFSRLRRQVGSTIPLRMRAASNPGGIGHEWVKERFIDKKGADGRLFFPAGLRDNPYIDQETYRRSLMNLDPVTRAQLLDGDWTVRPTGGKFKREWFKLIDALPANEIRWVRYWDMAATAPREGVDPDWTVGCLIGVTGRRPHDIEIDATGFIPDGQYVIADVRRFRENPADTERMIGSTAEMDARQYGEIAIRMELEPGASGLIAIDSYARGVLRGRDFLGDRATGDKELRANPLSAAVYNGNVRILSGAWVTDYLQELEVFPQPEGVAHDDQVDATSGGFAFLNEDEFLMHV